MHRNGDHTDMGSSWQVDNPLVRQANGSKTQTDFQTIKNDISCLPFAIETSVR
jgi:hypothetical protein